MLVGLENTIGLQNFRTKMFGLFKRTKVESWETELLLKVIAKLPKDYSLLMDQVKGGLFRGVLTDVSDIPGYVAFTYNHDILKKFDKERARDYKLTNIKVYDKKSSSFLPYEIYVSSGTISGYSLKSKKKYELDLNRVDVSDFRREFIGESDFNRLADVLSENEKKLLNPSEVYSVFINKKEYLHIKDLEDGDFIGIDTKKVVYRVTHDPMEVVVLHKRLIEVLKEN